MKPSWKIVAGALLLALPGPWAQASDSFVDLYTVPFTDLEAADFSSDSGGFGVGARGRFAATADFFLQGEYQLNQYDGFGGAGVDGEATDLRVGLGFLTPADARVYGLFEFVQLRVEIDGLVDQDESGYGIHLGMRGEGESHLYGQVGFLDLGDTGDGLEFMLGGAFRFTRLFGMFVDYRVTTLESGLGPDTDVSDLRIGLRLNFGD